MCLVQILFLLFPAKDALFSWYHDMLAAVLKHQACSCSPLVKLPLCSSDIRTYTYEKRQIIIFIFLSNAWQVGDSRGSAVCRLMQQRHMRLPQPAKVQCFTCSPVCCWTLSRGFFPALIKCSMYKLPQIKKITIKSCVQRIPQTNLLSKHLIRGKLYLDATEAAVNQFLAKFAVFIQDNPCFQLLLETNMLRKSYVLLRLLWSKKEFILRTGKK